MSAPTIVVGLAGGAGSGKSTAAAFLEKYYGARRYAFADPLKQIAMRTMGFTHEQCYGTQAQKEAVDPRCNMSPRVFLQRLGTEGIRSVLGPDFWWEHTLKKIREERPALAVIEDVRFPNESEALLDYAAVLERRMLQEYRDEALRAHAELFRAALTDSIVGHVWRLLPAPDAPQNTTADATHASEAQVLTLRVSDEIRPPRYGITYLQSALTERAHAIGLRMPLRSTTKRHADDCTCGSAYCG